MKKTKIMSDKVKGRGVYALESIRKGEVIEICQLIIMDFREVGGLLERYVFDFSPSKVALALGNGSLYNHTMKPNAKCWMDDKNKLLSLEALKNINIGDEITINYGYSKEDRKRFNIR